MYCYQITQGPVAIAMAKQAINYGMQVPNMNFKYKTVRYMCFIK